ncbi:MAG TPA: N-acetylmuramoyl-L-alanine amidase [Planctomycetota bacterium]|nr:N-acetylmuramoyl-L-alanine amidase [Planctomycetota bacterium]
MRHARLAASLCAVFLLAATARAEDTAPVSTAVSGDIERWVKTLGSKNGWISLDAVDYLPYFGRAAVPALLDGLASADSNTRCLSCVALARIPDTRSIPRLLDALDDKGGLVLNTLSQDGESLHAVYPKPEHTVGQQARFALQAITGKRFEKKDDWVAWWAANEATFQAPPLEEPEWPKLPKQAQWLKGIKICLDPGHGGDRDKQGYKRGLTYLSEADLNLRVARYVRDLLVKAGAEVVMTRDGDYIPGGDARHELSVRCWICGHEKCDLFLSVHHNWTWRLDETATTTWYHLTPDDKPASIDLARAVQEEAAKAIESKDPPHAGGLMSDGLMYKSGFGVLRELPKETPGCLCELTYYSSFGMERKLRDLEFNRKEAWGVFLGFVRYMSGGIPKAELVSSQDDLVLQVKDGTEEHGEWAKPFRIFSEHTLVKLDGRVVSNDYDPKTGRITVSGSQVSKGDHQVEVVLININKNHSWPRRIAFSK